MEWSCWGSRDCRWCYVSSIGLALDRFDASRQFQRAVENRYEIIHDKSQSQAVMKHGFPPTHRPSGLRLLAHLPLCLKP